MRDSRPLVMIASDPTESVETLGMMPGSTPMRPTKLRLIDGSATSSRDVMFPPISFDVVSTSWASDETVTVSWMPPTASWMSIVAVLPTSS